MKKLALLFALFAVNGFSQPITHNWSSPYGGTTDQFSQTIAGNGSGEIVTVGFFDDEFHYEDADDLNIITSNGLYDVFIMKTNVSGGVIWTKRVGGTGIEYGFDNHIDNTGNIYITGTFQDTVDFDPNEGVFELSAAGSNPDIFVLKLTSNGDFVWAKAFTGSGYDYGKTIITDDLGNVYVAGEFQNTVDFDPGAGTTNLTSNGLDDIFLVKLDENGDLIWANSYGASERDYGTALAVDNTGSVILTGSFRETVDFDNTAAVTTLTAIDENDAYILKNTTNGELIWVKQIGGNEGEDPLTITTNNANDIFIGGSYSGTADLDPGENEFIYTSSGLLSGYMVQLEANGDLKFIQGFGSSDYLAVSQLMITENQDICIGGFFTGTAGVETASGTPSFVSAGNEDLFMLVLGQDHQFKWSGQFESIENLTMRGIASGEAHQIYVGGMFKNTMDADPNVSTQNISGLNRALFLVKLDASTLTVQQERKSDFSIFPNPNKGTFSINFTNELVNETLFVYSLQGELIDQTTLNEAKLSIDLPNVPSGIYIIRINNSFQRVVIQK